MKCIATYVEISPAKNTYRHTGYKYKPLSLPQHRQ